MIRPEDADYLDDRGYSWQATSDGGFVNLVINDWPVPPGLSPTSTSLLVRLPAGFNVGAPDMFWCDPPLSLPIGSEPQATNVRNNFDGRQWQRWSRHIGTGWRPGIDNVATYLHYVARAMAQGAGKAAA